MFHAWLSIGLSLQQLHFDTNCSNVWPERFHVPSSNPRSQDQVTFFSALLPKSASILYYFLNLSSAAPTRFLVFVFNVLVDPKLDPSKHSLGIAEAGPSLLASLFRTHCLITHQHSAQFPLHYKLAPHIQPNHICPITSQFLSHWHASHLLPHYHNPWCKTCIKRT